MTKLIIVGYEYLITLGRASLAANLRTVDGVESGLSPTDAVSKLWQFRSPLIASVFWKRH